MPEFKSDFEPNYQSAIKFEVTASSHKISYEPDNKDKVSIALTMAAFQKAKVAPGAYMSGYKDYKSEIDPERAKQIIEETADKKTKLLFFLDYVHGKEVKVGAKENDDQTITLIDRTGNPVPKEKAKSISQTADEIYGFDLADDEEQ